MIGVFEEETQAAISGMTFTFLQLSGFHEVERMFCLAGRLGFDDAVSTLAFRAVKSGVSGG